MLNPHVLDDRVLTASCWVARRSAIRGCSSASSRWSSAAERTVRTPTAEERLQAGVRHLGMLVRTAGESVAAEMRKHVAWYIKGLPHSARVREQVNHTRSADEMMRLLQAYLPSWPRTGWSTSHPSLWPLPWAGCVPPAELRALLGRVRGGKVTPPPMPPGAFRRCGPSRWVPPRSTITARSRGVPRGDLRAGQDRGADDRHGRALQDAAGWCWPRG